MHKKVDLKKEYLPTSQFNPSLLRCGLFQPEKSGLTQGKLQQRFVYDYEIEYFLGGRGGILVDGTFYPVRKGDVMFRRPGSIAQGILPYSCYVLVLDIKSNTGKTCSDYQLEQPQSFQTFYLNKCLDAIPILSHPFSHEKYLPLFDSILQESLNVTEVSSLTIKANILQILHQLYLDNHNPFTNMDESLSPYEGAIRRAVSFIVRHYAEKIKLEDISRHVHMSPNYFHSIFRKIVGITPNEYLTDTRMERSKELLVKTDLNVQAIALRCGFENTPYFNYVFKKKNKVTPGEFRKQHRLYH